MQQKSKGVPYKLDHEKPEREFKILDNGDVEMTEIIKATALFHGREFMSFVREHEHVLENINEKLTDDFRKKLETDRDEMQGDLVLLRSLNTEVELILVKEQAKQVKKTILTNFKKTLGLPMKEIKKAQFSSFWENEKQEIKEHIMKNITPEEKKKFMKIIAAHRRTGKK